MNRTTVALLAALEAVIVAAIGLGIVLVPLTVLWAAHLHLLSSWSVIWCAAVDIWLVGHGTDLTVTLDARTVVTLGLPDAAAPFQVSIALLGFALLTAGLGMRTGLRAAGTPFRLTGVLSAVATFAVVSMCVTLTAVSAVVRPSVWQGIVLPPFVYALGIVVGLGFAALRSATVAPDTSGEPRPGPGSPIVRVLRDRLDALPDAVRIGSAAAFRAGSAAAALVIGVSALALAVLIFGNYGTIITLYEQLQGGVLGGIALTLGQLAFLPDLVIWTASWFVGPGFAVGTGSSVSPIGTELGPLPSLPLFGVIPAGGFSFGLVGIIVPMLAGFLAAVLVRSRLWVRLPRGPLGLSLIALGIGIVAGVQLGLLAWWSSGALGPGRLHDVGPNPWLIGVSAAAEVAVAAAIGLLTGKRHTADLLDEPEPQQDQTRSR